MDDTQISIIEALQIVTQSIKAWTDVQIENVNEKLSNHLYEKIAITNFSNNIGVAEIGSVVNTVMLNWSVNKTPISQSIDGISVDVNSNGYVFNDLDLKSNKTFTLVVTDEQNATASKSVSITFLNGIYYGVLSSDAELNSETICSLTKKLQSSKSTQFTVSANNNEHIVYALPSKYGTPVFNVGGFDGGFHKKSTIEFTNSSGHKGLYDIWMSDNVGLGQLTVNVM